MRPKLAIFVVATFFSSAIVGAPPARSATPPRGALAQMEARPACVSETGTGDACADGRALLSAQNTSLSPDGRFLYASGFSSDAIAVFSRNVKTGGLTQLPGQDGCVSRDGTGGACSVAPLLDLPRWIEISPDGRHAYVSSQGEGAVLAFARDKATGVLTQIAGQVGCVSDDGSGGQCQNGKSMDTPQDLRISPDGRHIYVVNFALDGGVAVLKRDRATGGLTQPSGPAGCLTESGLGGECTDGRAIGEGPDGLRLSPRGEHLYVQTDGGGVAILKRNRRTGALSQAAGAAGCITPGGLGGACAEGVELEGPGQIAFDRAGRFAYITSGIDNAVASFRRNVKTGALTQLTGLDACTSEDGSGGTCRDGKALDFPYDLTVSRDGRHLYVLTQDSDGFAIFSRNKKTGAISQLSGTDGCVTATGTGGECAVGAVFEALNGIQIDRTGRHLYATSILQDAIVSFERDRVSGAIRQLSGEPGCTSRDGSDECVNGAALSGAADVVTTRDGRHVYVASNESDAVAAFRRENNGRLTQLAGVTGCVSETGSGGACENGRALTSTNALAVAPDGGHVYAVATGSDAVVVLERNASTGELDQVAGMDGCVSDDGTGGDCVDGRGLGGAIGVAVDRRGSFVYVASRTDGAVAVFKRNTSTGVLTQLDGTAGCVSETGADGCADGKALGFALGVAVAPDGKHLYATSQQFSAVAVFKRSATTGAITQLDGTGGCVSDDGMGGECGTASPLGTASRLVFDNAGTRLYVSATSDSAVSVFKRNRRSGLLSAAGCVSEGGAGGCTAATGIQDAFGVALSRDGRSAYITGTTADAVAVFSRSRSGALSQLDGTDACWSETGAGTCSDGRALDGAQAVAVDPSGRQVYVASFESDAIAIFDRRR